jgi:hypothetical protein
MHGDVNIEAISKIYAKYPSVLILYLKTRPLKHQQLSLSLCDSKKSISVGGELDNDHCDALLWINKFQWTLNVVKHIQ